MVNVEQAIAECDTRIFGGIKAQLSENDKRSLLALQRAIRATRSGYTYLEIGSYLGGSIQPHVLDPCCGRIYSIDRRSVSQSDDRGIVCRYPHNSSERMLELLGTIAGERVRKVQCFDMDSSAIPPGSIDTAPDLCFIDGEHTVEAVLRDYAFCRRVIRDSALLVFHDAPIIHPALRSIISDLLDTKADFRAFVLPNTIFCIEFGDGQIAADPAVHDLCTNSYLAYFIALDQADWLTRIRRNRVVKTFRYWTHLLRGKNLNT